MDARRWLVDLLDALPERLLGELELRDAGLRANRAMGGGPPRRGPAPAWRSRDPQIAALEERRALLGDDRSVLALFAPWFGEGSGARAELLDGAEGFARRALELPLGPTPADEHLPPGAAVEQRPGEAPWNFDPSDPAIASLLVEARALLAERVGEGRADDDAPRPSPDFRSVVWRGVTYSFTVSQAQAVEVLFAAWQIGTPEVSQDHVLEKISSGQRRLRDVFRVKVGGRRQNHAAWGALIVAGGTNGTSRIAGARPKT